MEHDNKITELRQLVDKYHAGKEAAAKWKKEASNLKAQLISFMEKENVDSFDGTDVKASLTHLSSATCPKGEDKKLTFDWIREHHGAEYLDSVLTINARTFASFFTECETAATEKGELDFKIPGVDPYPRTNVSLRKK